MALDPMIAGGFRGIELQNPLEAYARVAQLQQAQQAEQLNALKLQEMRRSAEEQNRLRTAIRPDFDPTNPQHQAELYRAAPTIAPGVIEKALLTRKTVADIGKARAEAQDKQMRALGIGLSNVLDNPTDEALELAFKTLESTGVDVAPYRSQFAQVTDIGQRKRFITNYVTSHPEGRAALEFVRPKPKEVDVSGKKIFIDENPNSPSFGQEIITGQAVQPFPADVEEQKKRLAAAGRSVTTVNVSTEKKYGEAFGSKLAEVDINKLTTAEKAPQLADSANRIIGLVQQGNLFTGPIANIKLNIARALNVAGASNQEKIANTEMLIAATGQSTLDAIKGAGLGTGQGFTDKDLNFLRGIAGGTIELTQKTLTELATLQHRVAERSAQAWNKRVKEMPKEVVQGTGLSTTPITVPPLVFPKIKTQPSAVGRPPPAGVDAELWNVMTTEERALWQK